MSLLENKTNHHCINLKIPKCTFERVERRLEDSLIHWTNADRAYFNPDRFRVYSQSCITSLRTVTFVLQNLKRNLENFDDWYSNQRSSMREDLLMKWLVEARNTIEKQGDLNTLSTAIATVHTSWTEQYKHRTEIPPRLKPKQIAQLIAKSTPPEIIKDGYLFKVERRWVDLSLPENELLDSLRHCYSKLIQIVQIAHTNFDCIDCAWFRKTSLKPLPASMVNHKTKKTAWYDLKNGGYLETECKQIKFTKKMILDSKVEERYGNFHKNEPINGATLERVTRSFFSMAKEILSVDGCHRPIAILINDKGSQIVQVDMENRSEKHFQIRKLGELARNESSKMVLLINELWIAPFDERNFIYAADNPDRGEAIGVNAVSSDGSAFNCFALFSREGNTIEFKGDSFSQDLSNIMIPILEAILSSNHPSSNADKGLP